MDKWNVSTMPPRWMNVTITILKWFMVTLPFVICSVKVIVNPEMPTSESWLWVCIHCMACWNLIRWSDNK